MGIISAGIGVVVAGLIGYQINQFTAAKLTPKQENKPIQFTETPSKTTTAQYQCNGRQHGIPCEGNLCGY